MEKEYVLIGKIINTHGIKGDLKIESYTDFVNERFKKGSVVYIGEEHLPFTVRSCRVHKGYPLVTFLDHEDINLVEKYKTMNVYKAKEDIHKLKEGEYYFSEIEGLDVYVKDNKVGKVKRMEEGVTCNYMRVLKDEDGKESLVPFLPPFIEKVDLENKKICLVEMEGLL